MRQGLANVDAPDTHLMRLEKILKNLTAPQNTTLVSTHDAGMGLPGGFKLRDICAACKPLGKVCPQPTGAVPYLLLLCESLLPDMDGLQGEGEAQEDECQPAGDALQDEAGAVPGTARHGTACRQPIARRRVLDAQG